MEAKSQIECPHAIPSLRLRLLSIEPYAYLEIMQSWGPNDITPIKFHSFIITTLAKEILPGLLLLKGCVLQFDGTYPILTISLFED